MSCSGTRRIKAGDSPGSDVTLSKGHSWAPHINWLASESPEISLLSAPRPRPCPGFLSVPLRSHTLSSARPASRVCRGEGGGSSLVLEPHRHGRQSSFFGPHLASPAPRGKGRRGRHPALWVQGGGALPGKSPIGVPACRLSSPLWEELAPSSPWGWGGYREPTGLSTLTEAALTVQKACSA